MMAGSLAYAMTKSPSCLASRQCVAQIGISLTLLQTQAKYHQTHRSGGHTITQRDTGKTTRGSTAPAASQSYGRTAGDNQHSWGGDVKKTTNGQR